MTDIPVKELNPEYASDNIKSKWWDEDDTYRHVFGVVKGIRQDQEYRKQDFLKWARLYSNAELLGFYGSAFVRPAATPRTTDRITLNVCKSCVDTSSAKIAKNKPKPLFLTSNGDYKQQTRAKKLTKYIQGAFDASDFYTLMAQMYTSGAVLGTGVIKIFKDTDKMKVSAEHVLTDEIVVDDTEGMYGSPRQLHQTKYVSRDILMAMFGDTPIKKQKIKEVKGGVDGEVLRTAADVVKVVESWHLKSATKANDGMHAICIENCTLFTETYEKDYFPFVFFRYAPRLLGFFGSGIIENIVGIQVEINRILLNIQRAQHLTSVPRVAIENSSMVNSMHINNDIGAVYKYSGTPPIFHTPSAMPGEIYQHLWNLYAKAFEIEGINLMNATGQKPAGLDAAVALREYNDIGTERFVQVGQRYENCALEAAKIFIDLSRDLYEEDKSLKVNVKGKKFIETIKWSEVDLEDDQFIMQVYPTSSLPSDPAGKLQTIQEYMKAGFLGKDEAMSLLDFPDLDAFLSLQLAAIDDANMIIDQIIEEGVYTVPEPQMNLELLLQMTQSSYLRGKTTGVPEERQELLIRLMDDCNDLLGLTQPPAPPMPMPLANPEAPPTSELLPSLPTNPVEMPLQ